MKLLSQWLQDDDSYVVIDIRFLIVLSKLYYSLWLNCIIVCFITICLKGSRRSDGAIIQAVACSTGVMEWPVKLAYTWRHPVV